MYTVTRQRQWPNGDLVVEVSQGGLDYTNPDALVAKYPGEFETFLDPRVAVETAIAIVRGWRKDTRDERVYLGIGATLGFTMPFDPISFRAARKWAKQTYLAAPKCPQCGKLLPAKQERFRAFEIEDEEFCSENCAEQAIESALGG